MSRYNAGSDAEWVVETIVDDFAESLEPAERARFYERLAELAAERSGRGKRLPDIRDRELGLDLDLDLRIN